MTHARRSANARPGTVIIALAATAAVGTAVWLLVRSRRPRRNKRRPAMPTLAAGRGLHVERTVTVLRSPQDLYAEWRDLGRWPELVPGLRSVTQPDDRHSHWVATGPGGIPVEWDAELVADEPGHLISWRSVGNADVDNAGSVRFVEAPGGRGTEVKVVLTYAPPAGRLGAAVASVVGKNGDRQVREGLRRFKQRMEAREVAVAAASTDAPRAEEGA